MSDTVEGSVKSLGIFSTLESAPEFRFFLLAGAFVLLVDDVFLWLHQPGLVELATNPTKLETANLGLRVILVFVMFSFLTSLLLKIAAFIVDEISRVTVGNAAISMDIYLEGAFGNQRFPLRRKHDHVRPMELREQAHRTKDIYYITQYEKYEMRWIEAERLTNRIRLYAFYTFTLATWSWWLGRKGADSTVARISNFLGSEGYFAFFMMALAIIFLYRFLRKDDPE
jgi:hypothetical protein